jgi:hypothetical protein
VGRVSLSFQQKQLIKQNTRNSPQYFSAKYSLSGALDTQRLIAALSALIHEHEILRTSFRNVLGENSDVLMVINEPYKPELVMAEGEPSDAGEFNEEKTALACGGPLDTERPLNATLYRIADDKHTLVITVPAASLDYVSADAMMAALSRLYDGEASASSPSYNMSILPNGSMRNFLHKQSLPKLTPYLLCVCLSN